MSHKATASKITDSKNNTVSTTAARLTMQSPSSLQAQVIQLHRQYGNQAVQRMYETGKLQAKLKIGKPGDKYEQEAERVADRVMNLPEPVVNRQEEEKEEIQPQSLSEKITPLVRRTEDKEEEVQEQPVEKEEEPVQSELLQRQAGEEEKEEVQGKPLIQKEADKEEEIQEQSVEDEEAQTKQIVQRETEEEKEESQAKSFAQREEKQEEEVQQQNGEQEEGQAKLFVQKDAEQDEEEGNEQGQAKLIQKQVDEDEEVKKQAEEDEDSVQSKILQRQAEDDEAQTKLVIQKEEKEEEESPQTKLFVQKKNNTSSTLSSSTEASLRSIKGSGNPLPDSTRTFMEDRFGSDFNSVRVHTDTRADTLAGSMNARAFTLGSDIAFKSGQYSPETSRGKRLLAHEFTHVVQQNPRISRKASSPTISHQTTESKVQGVWGWIKKKAKKAWKGIKKVGSKIAKGVLNFLQKAKDFIANQVRKIPGYSFVAALLGKDPISGKKVKPKGGLLRAVFSLLGKEKIYDQLVKANIVGKAVKVVKDSFKSANLTGKFIIGSIKNIWSVISINPLTWRKAAGMFVSFLGSLIKKVLKVGWNLLTKIPLLILEGFLILVGAPVKKIMGILNKGKQVILKIASNPIAFIGNLFGALKKGFFQFMKNIWKHLKAGLMGWLMGSMEGAGIQLPQKWDLKGIINLVLQILGLTYQRIKQKVVKKLGPKGEQIVSFMEKAVSFVVTLVKKGPMGLWERIKEKAAEIRDAAIDAIKNWIVTKIVMAAVTKLATMFNPVGAIVQAALAIYNTIMFFIERAKQIAAVVEAVFNSIAPIAYGRISKAANWIEKTMARTIPVILGFLARLIGLGGISAKIKKVVTTIRKPIDKVVDKVIDWIVTKAKALFGKGKGLVKKGVEKVKKFLFPQITFKAGKESHKVWIDISKKKPVPMMASETVPIKDFIDNLNDGELNDKQKVAKTKAKNYIEEMNKLFKTIEKTKDKEIIKKCKGDFIILENDLVLSLKKLPVVKAENLEVYKLEGMTGRHTRLRSLVPGKKFQAHHVPQDALLKYVKDLNIFKGKKAKKYTTGQGWTILMHQNRHSPTFALDTHPTKLNPKKEEIHKESKKFEQGIAPKEVREKIVEKLKYYLSKSVGIIKNIYKNDDHYKDLEDRSEIKKKVKEQGDQGADRLEHQNLDELADSN